MNGFALDGGWYGIALGPHTRPDAEQVLRVCRNKGVIPRDSYIALGCTFCRHFWPMGGNVLDRGVLAAPVETPAEPARRMKPAQSAAQRTSADPH